MAKNSVHREFLDVVYDTPDLVIDEEPPRRKKPRKSKPRRLVPSPPCIPFVPQIGILGSVKQQRLQPSCNNHSGASAALNVKKLPSIPGADMQETVKDKNSKPEGHLIKKKRGPQTHKRFGCQDCGMRFERRKEYEHHTREEHKVSFQCPDCIKQFNNKFNLERHQRTHAPNTLNFVCPWEDCGKRFLFGSQLKEHILQHQQVKHRCPWTGCNAEFTHYSNFKRHHLTHTAPTFPCTKPNCKYSTNSTKNMTEHRRAHDIKEGVIDPYKCPHCSEVFYNRPSLHRHKRKCTGSGGF